LTASIFAGANRSFVARESDIFYRLKEGAAETNKRPPLAPLPGRLLAHLRRRRARKAIAQWVVEWEGESVKVAFARALREAGITKHITPHTMRDTAATRLMQNGAAKWDAAGYLGMSEKTLTEVCGHHHPDYLKDPADRITRKRPGRR